MASPLPAGLHGEFLNTYGGIFMGNLIAAIVFGVVSVQAMHYFHVFRRDRSSTQAVVAFLWLVLFFPTVMHRPVHVALLHPEFRERTPDEGNDLGVHTLSNRLLDYFGYCPDILRNSGLFIEPQHTTRRRSGTVCTRTMRIWTSRFCHNESDPLAPTLCGEVSMA